MSNEITSTHDMAEEDWDGESGPSDVRTDMVATQDAEERGIEFHVSMRDYTLSDMEELIVDAAAKQIVGRHNDRKLAEAIEAKCISLISDKADQALASVTREIIDQPITPKYPFTKSAEPPMTMREFIGLTGRDYLAARVDGNGKPASDRMYSKSRIQWLVEQAMDAAFKREIEKATNIAASEVQKRIRESHEAFLKKEKQRLADALAKMTAENQ